MNVSYEGIGQWAATFACDGVSAGQVVKVSGSGTVAKCADNDSFEGVVLSVARDGKACSVAMGGMVTVPIYGPGGYVWLPESGASVLVIKGGPGGEEQCVCGGKQAEVPKGMQPGEVYIYGPKGSNVYLQKDGTIELTGRISIRGQLLINGQPYKPCTCGEGGIL